VNRSASPLDVRRSRTARPLRQSVHPPRSSQPVHAGQEVFPLRQLNWLGGDYLFQVSQRL